MLSPCGVGKENASRNTNSTPLSQLKAENERLRAALDAKKAAELRAENETLRKELAASAAAPPAARTAQTPIANKAVEWRTEGHPFLGQTARRYFPGYAPANGLVTRWLPPSKEGEALFHVKHDDDDEEDLNEAELEAAFADLERAQRILPAPHTADQVGLATGARISVLWESDGRCSWWSATLCEPAAEDDDAAGAREGLMVYVLRYDRKKVGRRFHEPERRAIHMCANVPATCVNVPGRLWDIQLDKHLEWRVLAEPAPQGRKAARPRRRRPRPSRLRGRGRTRTPRTPSTRRATARTRRCAR